MIDSLIAGTIREKDIPLWSIKKWTDPQLSVYIPTISIFPSGEKAKDRKRGRYLIIQSIKWAITLNKLYDIKNWYAIAATKEGKHLLVEIGFKPIKGTREGYYLEHLEEGTKSFIKGIF